MRIRSSGFKYSSLILSCWFWWVAGTGTGLANAEQSGGSIYTNASLYWENDVFAGTDRDYTNGLKFTICTALLPGNHETKHMPSWSYDVMNRLPFVRDQNAFRGFAFSLGQSIYTPADTQQSDDMENDRPYAGYLYSGFGFQAHFGRRFSIWELDLGVVGPMALGEELQNFVHSVIGSRSAQGWDNQLDNEPAIQVIHETKWRLWDQEIGGGFGLGLIGHAGGQLGNVAILANTGAEIRFGWQLPEDFGSCPIRPGCNESSLTALNDSAGSGSRPFSFHFFMGFDGRLVLRDIFIDGNTFGDGTNIDREPLVADAMAGIAFSYKQFKMSYSYVLRTKQFEQQDEDQLFGAISIYYIF